MEERKAAMWISFTAPLCHSIQPIEPALPVVGGLQNRRSEGPLRARALSIEPSFGNVVQAYGLPDHRDRLIALQPVQPTRRSETVAIRSASGVCTVMVPPYVAVAGAALIVGRVPLNR